MRWYAARVGPRTDRSGVCQRILITRRCHQGPVRKEKENIMRTFRIVTTRVLLVAAPLAFLVIETAGRLHP